MRKIYFLLLLSMITSIVTYAQKVPGTFDQDRKDTSFKRFDVDTDKVNWKQLKKALKGVDSTLYRIVFVKTKKPDLQLGKANLEKLEPISIYSAKGVSFQTSNMIQVKSLVMARNGAPLEFIKLIWTTDQEKLKNMSEKVKEVNDILKGEDN